MMGDFIRGCGTRFRARIGSGEAGRAQGAPPERGRLWGAASFANVLARSLRHVLNGAEVVARNVDDQQLRLPRGGGERMELVELMSELARLLSTRSSTPRRDALRLAHRRIRRYAESRGLGESWCDAVMLQFLADEHGIGAIA